MAKRHTKLQNMGTADRLIRGLAGAVLMANGLRHIRKSPLRAWETAIGGAFLMYGVSGIDPLLHKVGATTIPGTENSVWNQIRATLPGQGIKPILTQNVIPRSEVKPFPDNVPISQALAIG